MRLSFIPFPNAISIIYMCPPAVLALNFARFGHSLPPNLPEGALAMRVWVELPRFEAVREASRIEQAAAWAETNRLEIERAIRADLIRPGFLN